MRRIGGRVELLPDDALLAGFCAGEPESALAFVRRFESRVLGVALAVLGDRHAAEDVAQLAFERAWRHGHTYDPRRGSVLAWLCSIARNAAIDAARVRRPALVDAAQLVEQVAGGEDPERRALSDDAAARLRCELARLPAEQARALVLAGIAGLSASQVAACEHIPLGTAKTRIRAAMLRLRAALSESEVDDA